MHCNKKGKQDLLERVLSGGTIILVSSLIRYGIETAYRKKTGTELSGNPYTVISKVIAPIFWGTAIFSMSFTGVNVVSDFLNNSGEP